MQTGGNDAFGSIPFYCNTSRGKTQDVVDFFLQTRYNGDKSTEQSRKSPMSMMQNKGCDPAAIREYLALCARDGVTLRSFRLYRKGKTLSADFTPHRADDRMHLYSLSKSFTSVAVGIAQEMGLLHVSERMLDIFPECAPPEISENLAAMTLGDVLSMQSGHEVCHLDKMRLSEDAVRTFLAMPVVYRPGTTFVYSTGGTCVCGAAVEKRSGMKLNDFLQAYLFSKLGIQRPRALCLADGRHCGGTGMFLSADDVLKFGMMLLHGGVYEGQRIVSEEWLRGATSPIADNSSNGTPDWVVGYGYQFWRNARGGFRGDGAFGQLCVVLPEEDTVVVQLAEAANMQQELSDIYTLLDAIDRGGSDTDEPIDAAHPALNGAFLHGSSKEIASYQYKENPAELRSAALSVGADGVLTVRFETAYGVQILRAGGGEWVESSPFLRYCNPSINQLDPHFGWIEELHIRSSFAVEGDTVRVLCKHSDTPHTQTFLFTPDALRISANLGDLHPQVKEIPCR